MSERNIVLTQSEYVSLLERANKHDVILANLTATQERCNELLEDSRLKSRRIVVLEAEIEAMRKMYDMGIVDLEFNMPHVHRCIEDGHSYGHGDDCFYCGHRSV